MNEETTLPAEMPSDPEPSVVPETDAAEAAENLDGALTEGAIYEDLSGANYPCNTILLYAFSTQLEQSSNYSRWIC